MNAEMVERMKEKGGGMEEGGVMMNRKRTGTPC